MSYVVRTISLLLLVFNVLGFAVFAYYSANRVRSAPDTTAGETTTTVVFGLIGFVILAIAMAFLTSSGTDNDEQ